MELGKNYLKKLKNLSFHKILFFLFLLFLLFLRVFFFLPKTKITTASIEGKIQDIKIDGNQVSILLKAKEKVWVFYYVEKKEELSTYQNFHLGDTIKVEGSLKQPSQNQNFFLFDYQKNLKSQKIFWILEATQIVFQKENKNLFYKIKNKIIEYLKKIDTTGYLKAFVLGKKEGIKEEAKEAYSKLGISHLFAISGMHISFFTAILFWFFKRYNPIFIFLLFYLFLTDFSISVLRATFFYLFFTMKKKYSLKITNMEFFGTLCFLFLLYNPYYLYSLSFQFSFSISGTLLWLMPKWKGKKRGSAFLLSLISFFVSIPILANHFFEINLLSPFYNLVYVPMVTIFLFPLGIITLFCPILEPFFAFIIKHFEKITSFWVKIPSYWILKKIPLWALFLFFLSILFFLFKITKRKYKYLFPLIGLIFLYPYFPSFLRYSFVSIINVGQGDAILLHFKSGENILIDTGGVLSFQKEWQKKKRETSIAKDIIIPSLKAFGIKKLDYLIISHGDYDHIGGSFELIKNFPVKQVFFNKGKDSIYEKDLQNLLLKKGISYEKIRRKQLLFKENGLFFINPKEEKNENEDSLIVYTSMEKRNILFMADVGKEKEKELIQAYNLPEMDILKVGHHGSKNSSSNYFLKTILPQYAVISVGKNYYGHPHQETIERLKEVDASTYMTSIHGGILFLLKEKIKVYTASGTLTY